jgi:hypothetical protein
MEAQTMLTRRPTLIAVAAALALLIPVALAPAAQAGTQVRQFEALGITMTGPGANSPRVGDMALNFVFKNNRAGGKYTPRRLTRVRFSELPLRCHEPGSPSTTTAPLTADFAADVLMTKPQSPNPKPNRYAFRFSWDYGGFAYGFFAGTIDKANGKGWPRAHGKFAIWRYDFPAPGPTYCNTSRQIEWSVPKQCKRPGQSGDRPLCRFG